VTALAGFAHPVRRLLLTTAVFAALDFVWLSLLMGDFYKRHLGSLARRAGPDLAPLWWAALLVYLVLVVGLVAFALPKARSIAGGFAWGALFGVVAYGTYDLTCQAVLRDWPVTMTVVDMAWGATICGVTCAGVLAIEQRLGPRPFTLPARSAE
jgi:uncharacterized membrane protein